MSIAERDYIIRLIARFAEALARMVRHREQGELSEALAVAKETADGIFGPLATALDELAPAGVVLMLHDADKAAIYAALGAERAEVAEAMGRGRAAAAGRRRALEIYLEALALAPASERLLGAIEQLRPHVDAAALDARYLRLLEQLGRG
jgi:hypothetical protein